MVPQTIVAFAPILAPFLTKVLTKPSLVAIKARGEVTFVKTQDGPQKTPSSNVTPS